MQDKPSIRSHPGPELRVKVLKPRKLTVVKSAKLLDMSRGNLSEILAGRRDMTLEFCHQIAILFGENAEVWATKQMQHDLDKKGLEVQKLNLQPYKPRK